MAMNNTLKLTVTDLYQHLGLDANQSFDINELLEQLRSEGQNKLIVQSSNGDGSLNIAEDLGNNVSGPVLFELHFDEDGKAYLVSVDVEVEVEENHVEAEKQIQDPVCKLMGRDDLSPQMTATGDVEYFDENDDLVACLLASGNIEVYDVDGTVFVFDQNGNQVGYCDVLKNECVVSDEQLNNHTLCMSKNFREEAIPKEISFEEEPMVVLGSAPDVEEEAPVEVVEEEVVVVEPEEVQVHEIEVESEVEEIIQSEIVVVEENADVSISEEVELPESQEIEVAVLASEESEEVVVIEPKISPVEMGPDLGVAPPINLANLLPIMEWAMPTTPTVRKRSNENADVKSVCVQASSALYTSGENNLSSPEGKGREEAIASFIPEQILVEGALVCAPEIQEGPKSKSKVESQTKLNVAELIQEKLLLESSRLFLAKKKIAKAKKGEDEGSGFQVSKSKGLMAALSGNELVVEDMACFVPVGWPGLFLMTKSKILVSMNIESKSENQKKKVVSAGDKSGSNSEHGDERGNHGGNQKRNNQESQNEILNIV